MNNAIHLVFSKAANLMSQLVYKQYGPHFTYTRSWHFILTYYWSYFLILSCLESQTFFLWSTFLNELLYNRSYLIVFVATYCSFFEHEVFIFLEKLWRHYKIIFQNFFLCNIFRFRSGLFSFTLWRHKRVCHWV